MESFFESGDYIVGVDTATPHTEDNSIIAIFKKEGDYLKLMDCKRLGEIQNKDFKAIVEEYINDFLTINNKL